MRKFERHFSLTFFRGRSTRFDGGATKLSCMRISLFYQVSSTMYPILHTSYSMRNPKFFRIGSSKLIWSYWTFKSAKLLGFHGSSNVRTNIMGDWAYGNLSTSINVFRLNNAGISQFILIEFLSWFSYPCIFLEWIFLKLKLEITPFGYGEAYRGKEITFKRDMIGSGEQCLYKHMEW